MSLNKKIFLFIVSALISIWFGFFAFTKDEIQSYYVFSIFYILTFEILIWLITICNAYKLNSTHQSSLLHSIKQFINEHYLAIIVSILLVTVGFVVCEPDIRILSDEAMILSDTKALYETKLPWLSLSGIYTPDGNFVSFENIVDKRPLLFQYFVSLIHSLLGYDINNAFIANFIFAVISLFLFYYIVQLKHEKIWGICCSILLGVYPLFLLYASSAGMELFNLLCSLILILCIYNFIKSPIALNAEILILFLPLIAQTRYESVLSIFVAIPLIFYLLPKLEYQKLSYKILFFPIMFIPIPWLRIISDNAMWWEGKDPKDVFGVRFVLGNLKNALEFFFIEKIEYGNIAFISIFAALGFLLFLFYCIKKNTHNKYKIFWLSLFLFYFFHAIVRFMYVSVDFRHASASRLSMIFLPLLCYFATYLMIKIDGNLKRKFFRYIYLIVAVALPFIYWPNFSNENCGYKNLVGYQNYKITREILDKHYKNKNEFCIISIPSLRNIPLLVSSVNPGWVQNNTELFRNFIKYGVFKYFITIQIYMYGKPNFEIPDCLDAKVEYEQPFRKDFKVVFSRCNFRNSKN